MDREREDFKLSGPVHLTARSAIDWKNEHDRRSVAACLVQGVKVAERDCQKKGSQALASPWWKSFNFQMLEQLKYGDDDSSIFGAIYKFEPPASHSNLSTDGCPCYVIAFRGTLLKGRSFIPDLELDSKIILNTLHLDPCFEKALQAVRSKVVDSSNVWLAGHSLGSAIALLAGRTMAEEGIFLETFLFNLPYPSVPIEKIASKKLKHVIRGAGNMFRAGLALTRNKNYGGPLEEWAPCLFVNPGDPIGAEYVGYFEHKEKMEKFGLGGIVRLDTQVSLRGLFMGNESEPMHRIPSAYLTVNLTPSPDFKRAHGIPDFKRAHGIHQWWRPDLHLESKLYKYK